MAYAFPPCRLLLIYRGFLSAIRVHSERLSAKVQRQMAPLFLLSPAGQGLDSNFVCQALFCHPGVIMSSHSSSSHEPEDPYP